MADPNWDYSIETLPTTLQSKVVDQCFLEILNYGTGVNHCLLRLLFKHEQAVTNAHTPSGTRGILLDFSATAAAPAPVVPGPGAPPPVVPAGPVPVPGDMNMRTFRYDGAHRSSVHRVNLPIKGRKPRKVKDFLKVLDTASLLPCDFEYINTETVGCRDFT